MLKTNTNSILLLLFACVLLSAGYIAVAENTAGNSLFHLKSNWKDTTSKQFSFSHIATRKAWLAVMTYTSCQSACPVILSKIKALRAKIDRDIRDKVGVLVFSFDSVSDTPEVLLKYQNSNGYDSSIWKFLSGDRVSVQTLALVLGVKFKRDEFGDYEHSNEISVLDQSGRVIFQDNALSFDHDEVVKLIKSQF